ncbi:methyl-accepting chemotaxis protein [Pseudomonadota bacterium]
MKLTIRNKLLLGFAAVLMIVLLVSINTFYRIQLTTDIQTRLTDLRQPTVVAGMQLTNGVNLSLAGLRGYMILGSDPNKASIFKDERARGWKEIDAALAEFREFAKNWTVPANIERLENMEAAIEEFRIAQQEVEDVSHTDANIPSFNILLTDAAPRAAKVMASITKLINEENELEATKERKALLKLMADSRGSFAIGLANIRAYLLSGDAKFRDNFQAKWDVNTARFKQIEEKTYLFTPTQLRAWAEYKAMRNEFSVYPPQMFESRASKEWNRANHWLGSKAAPKAKQIMRILSEMRTSQDELAATDTALLKSQTASMTLWMVLGTVIALILGMGVSAYLSHLIVKPLSAVVNRAKEIANGNLTTPEYHAPGNDELSELSDSINSMNKKLHNVITKVSLSTTELASAANQLSSMAENTHKGMENQQQETEQVATAMNQMSATVHEVAKNAADAALSAERANNEASEGKQIVSQNMESIHTLATNIGKASETINKLGEETKSVDDIVEVINDIADQTSLLALNAAIEAARAGEQGRGFAVVADEVRTLAARTQESTEEIRVTLDRLKSGAENAVQIMDQGYQQAKHSVEQVDAAGNALTAITDAVAAINNMNSQIATASEEQSSVAEEMNQRIERINSESDETLQSTDETGAAAKQVGALSSQLEEMVAHFKIG